MASKRKTLPHETDGWKGYPLDEIRYLRAYTAARIEIQGEGLKNNVRNLNPLSRGDGSQPGGLFGRIFSALTYIDIAIIAFKVGSKVLHTVRRLRR